VVAIDQVAAAGDVQRRRQLHHAIDAGECIVYERDGRVLAFAVLKCGHFFGRDFVDLVFVAADARRQGVGRCLMQASVAAATSARVFTSTNTSNSAMQALLESEGWSRSGELDGLDEGDPELVYFTSRELPLDS